MKLILKILIILALWLCFTILFQSREYFCNCSENFSVMKEKQTLRGKEQQYALTSQLKHLKKHSYLHVHPLFANVKKQMKSLQGRFF